METHVPARSLLTVDAAINLALGALLLVFPRGVIRALGAPDAAHPADAR